MILPGNNGFMTYWSPCQWTLRSGIKDRNQACSDTLHGHRCWQGNKSMQTLQAMDSMSVFCLHISCKLVSLLQQEATSSTSQSPHPSLLCLLEIGSAGVILLSLYFSCCSKVLNSMDNCLIYSSSFRFLLLMSSTYDFFSLTFLSIFSSTEASVWNYFIWLFSNIDFLICSPDVILEPCEWFL